MGNIENVDIKEVILSLEEAANDLANQSSNDLYTIQKKIVSILDKINPEEVHNDNVNHPSHYTWLKDKCGIEVIDITRHMDFCLGNAIKYILRAGHKQDTSLSNKQKEIEDLKKAIWYINDKIEQLIINNNK